MSNNIDQLDLLYRKRMEDINPKDHIKDYQSRCDRWNSLYHEIESLLPKDKQNLIFDLDSESGAMAGDYEELGYKTGFNDAIRLFARGLMGEFYIT